ncbi:MAG: hypothetical protein ACU83N_09995 [Gammaproteobacteria bacterium]
MKKIIIALLISALCATHAWSRTLPNLKRVTDLAICPAGQMCIDPSGNIKIPGTQTIGTSGMRDNAGILEVSNGGGAYTPIATGHTLSDGVYPTGWDADTTNGVTRNAIYDALQLFQLIDTDLTALAALSTTAYGRALLELVDQAALVALLPSYQLVLSEGAFADGDKTKLDAINQEVATTSNPSFNSVHASGGNLAAANAQVTKKWITGLDYVADVTSVIHGGAHYICTSSHTAGATTEPGVGGSWATVWSLSAGDNLGTAAYTDVVALWTTCTGILLSDGTCVATSTYLTPAGNGSSLTGLLWSQIGTTPTTLAGYGITDAESSTSNNIDPDRINGDSDDDDMLDGDLIDPSANQTQEFTDSGDGSPKSDTVTFTAGIQFQHKDLTCSDSDGCIPMMSEIGAVDGQTVVFTNVGTNAFTWSDSSGVQELAATCALAQYETLTLIYNVDRWVEKSRATNAVAFGSITLPTTTSGDQALTAGQIGIKTDEDLIVYHGGAAGEVQDEAGLSLIQHISFPFDPSAWYDQESTYRSVPIMRIGDDFPHGFTIVEWRVYYVAGDPTTELDADLICDTTPDFNVAAGATVMDVLDTTTGASSADTGFDSATCANGSELYIHFGADPTDANVVIAFDLWGYAEEDE